MKGTGSRPEDVVGLCLHCRHGAPTGSGRGSVFHLCRLSHIDPTYPKYPRLPVLSCRGFEKTNATPPPYIPS